ncbi:MAG: hypothetical protein L6V95_03530 [Candidatus Melainabacteria bacterium]|nr:MAG: hypothetical protein L6V95_03530 [Candidatus Melainabacteria bacterium]
MAYSKGEFLIDLFTYFKCKNDALRLEDYSRLLRNLTIWNYKKCYDLILSEYRSSELPSIALVKEFRKKCRYDTAMKDKKIHNCHISQKKFMVNPASLKNSNIPVCSSGR